MTDEAAICAVCAWRATCRKKFSLSGKDMHCPDFVRDISIKGNDAAGDREGEEDESYKNK